MLRWIAAVTTWLATTAVLAPVCFFAVIFLAGPHAGLLPGFLEGPVVILFCGVLLGVPAWLARLVIRKMGPVR